MNPPVANSSLLTKDHGWSQCFGCNEWRKNVIFTHNKTNWVLCKECWEDYWFNEDELGQFKFWRI